MIDADCYIDASVILKCAAEIRKGRERSPREPVWFIPYRHFFRLTGPATLFLLASDPKDPFPFSSPPDSVDVGPRNGNDFGHWFGALIQIFPREAFQAVHGMDARFRGWGGEDVTFALLLDTLFGVHRLSSNQVLTLWHTIQFNPGTNPNLLRTWQGQDNPRQNWGLAGRYRKALRDPEAMRGVIDEWLNDPSLKQHRID